MTTPKRTKHSLEALKSRQICQEEEVCSGMNRFPEIVLSSDVSATKGSTSILSKSKFEDALTRAFCIAVTRTEM